MDDDHWLADRFEAHRGHLRGVAFRMLGSLSEADDAVQETWLRLSHADTSDIESLGGWLTTVTGRVCLDMLRSRNSRREEPLDGDRAVPDDRADPEQEALLADSVGVALLVVLDTLTPAERLAFVLHDMFAVPFDEIATIVDRSTDATKMLASRARRRVGGRGKERRAGDPVSDPDLARQREVVGAFLAAARDGDFDALLAVLDPDVAVRADAAALPGGAPARLRGARAVAGQALTFSRRTQFARLALVNGTVGIVVAPHGRVTVVMTFAVVQGKIVEIDVCADPARLHAYVIDRGAEQDRG